MQPLLSRNFIKHCHNGLRTCIKKKTDPNLNPTYQAFVTLQPDWHPFNSLGADVVNKFQTCLT